MNNNLFPDLPLEKWEDTKKTIHLYFQIIGKIRLAMMPKKNHWWYITLYLSSRGFTTHPIPFDHGTFEIEFDFIDHKLIIKTSEGKTMELALIDGLSVADFYKSVKRMLDDLDIKVKMIPKPFDAYTDKRFDKLTEFNSYDKEYANRFWRVMSQVDVIFKEFSGRFYGKTCPVHLYWHHMDLAVTRFSGKLGPSMEGASLAEKDAYSHEVISFGFWVGDENVREPAFYSYTFPLPEGITEEKLKPKSAQWIESNGSPMAFLSYNELRKEENPKQALLDFLESSYKAGAKRAGWNLEEFEYELR